jgi:hypothetical protein
VWQKKLLTERTKQSLEKIQVYAQSNKNTDTDGDGLLDWEEAFWGTDPKNPDTDSDGAPDGKEIEQRRDPLTPGPNDYVRSIGNPDQTITSSKEDLTESEKLMRGMLTTIMYSSDPTNKDFAKKVTQELADTVNAKGKTLSNTYNLSQIKTIPETDASLKLYGNTVGAALKTTEEVAKEKRAAMLIIATGIKEGKNTIFDEFDALIKKERNEASVLLKIAAPKDIAPFHLLLVNSAENIAFSMENLKFLISDPLRGLIAMEQYKTALSEAESARQKVRDHLDNSGITFSETETGSRI